MFKKIFSKNYVKVSSSDWDKISNYFGEYEREIERLKSELAKTEDIRKENATLKHYKQQDDLMYSLEEYNKGLVKENALLKEEVLEVNGDLDKTRLKLQSTKALESLYLQQIAKYKQNACIEYETKSIKEFVA